ncbi:MAG: hypothetical protein ACPLRW_07290 [Moorellales bacterium]
MRRLKVTRPQYKIDALPPGLLDAVERFMLAKRTEVLFGIVATVVGAGVVLLMLFWLLYQIRTVFF